jgi:hypothetical protein
MVASTSLGIQDLMPIDVPDENANLPALSEQGPWRVRLAREAHPHSQAEPLKALFDHFEAAAAWPAITAFQRYDDPLEVLRSALAGDNTAYQPIQVEPPQPVIAELEASPLEALLGREMLEIARSSALAPERRVEAVEKVAIALANPTRENVRAILVSLLRD